MPQRQLSDMVRNRQPVAFPLSTTVAEACRCMLDKRIGAVLVTDGDRLVGIFTGRDAVGRVLAEGRDPTATRLADVMTAGPETMKPEQTAIDALRVMDDCGIRHLPVVERGRVVGIISRGDFRGLEQARHDEETGFWERI